MVLGQPGLCEQAHYRTIVSLLTEPLIFVMMLLFGISICECCDNAEMYLYIEQTTFCGVLSSTYCKKYLL